MKPDVSTLQPGPANASSRHRHWARAATVVATLTGAFAADALAQDADEDTELAFERVVVTGSYLARGADDSITPVATVDRDTFEAAALQTPADILKTLTLNSGSVAAPDTTGSPFQVGTAQFNLRGLGLASTLTLINGQRQVVSPIPNDDGSSFVDINTLPLIMVERVEVLKDGAAALYGSDAVAGVANFVMRDDIDGLELAAQYQTTTEDSQEDTLLSAAWGRDFGNVRIAAGLEYLDRTPLEQNAREVSAGKIISGLGFPGAFAPGFLPIIDPNCAAAGGFPTPFGIPGAPEIGLCGTDLTPSFDLISAEERLTGYLMATWDLGGDIELTAEAGFADNEATVRSGPAFPNLKFPSVPADNPGNLIENGGFGVPVVFFGRALSGVNGEDTIQGRSNEMFRLGGALAGPVGATGWRYRLSAVHAEQQFEATGVTDVKIDRFQAALNGVGGPNNDQFFNPFGSSVLDPALANSPEVIDDFLADSFRVYDSSISVAELVVTGEPFSMPAGPAGLALGAQIREEALEFESDPDSRAGNLVFLFTGPNFSEERTVGALFGELVLPLTASLEAQVAARYESYSDDIGESFDPKLALRWTANDLLTLRGSVGTSFRAPSLSQTTSISTINGAVADPLNPSPIPFFRAIVTTPNPDLAPEESLNYTLGFIFEPNDAWTFQVDYWRYDYDDIIVKESAQEIINANPNDSRIIRQGGLPDGQISEVQVTFVNANSVETDGFDFETRFDHAFDNFGDLSLTARATYINEYVADTGDGGRDLAGKRNFQNFARSLPEWQADFRANWRAGGHDLNAIVRHVSAYEENLADPTSPINGFEIDAVTTLDLTYGYEYAPWQASVQVGVLNVFDELPPETAAPGDLQGFDRLVHDPRGRMVFVRLEKDF